MWDSNKHNKKKFKFCKYFESFWNNIKLLLWPSADGKIVGNFFFIFIKSLIVNNPNNIQLFVCLFCFPSYNKLSETLSNKNQLQWKPLNVIADNVIIQLLWSNWPKLTYPKAIFSAYCKYLVNLLIVIIRLMISNLICPKSITIGSFH